MRIVFNPMGRVVEVGRGTILLDAVREAGIMINSICGGKGQCGTCRVILNRGEVLRLSTKYEKWLSPQEISEGYHLACQTRVLSDGEFTIPVESRVFSPKILLSVETVIDSPDPASKKYLVARPLLRGGERRPLRLEGYSGPEPLVGDEVYNRLLSMEHGEPVTATLSRTGGPPEVISVESGDRTGSNYGLAVDLGTSTIAVLLVDLVSGEVLGRASGLNRQITYGETLVTRIAFAREAGGLLKLQRGAVESVNDLVDGVTSGLGIDSEEVTDVCVGGNTVMNHLLAGIDPSYLAYVDANEKVPRSPIIRKSGALGLRANPGAYVYCLPNVSRFLGGDAVGDVITSGMHESGEVSLLVDMGTNGEIIFGNDTWLVSCSCASGPAFEGEGIRFGMRGMEGGIEHVRIDPGSLRAEYTVIGETPPRGICGSGVIDAAAEMFSVGILDFTGRIVEGRTPLVRRGRDGPEYVIAPAGETAIGRDIVITQRDMDYIMDSKAAACGGVMVLMEKFRLSIYDVRNFYLAGAFGAYTDLRSATRLGIFPEFPNAEVHPIGNGSVSGAYAALLSMAKRDQASDVAEKMLYVDLLEDIMFTEAYSEALYIPGKKELFPSYSH